MAGLFGRYIDDCLGATFCSKEELERFIGFVKSFYPALKLTWEMSVTSVTFFDIKRIIWQPVFNICPQIRSYLLYPSSHPFYARDSICTPNFSTSVDSAAMIQTSTSNAMKCLLSFPNAAILTSYPKHSIVSKTSIENPLWNHQPQTMKNEFLSHLPPP